MYIEVILCWTTQWSCSCSLCWHCMLSESSVKWVSVQCSWALHVTKLSISEAPNCNFSQIFSRILMVHTDEVWYTVGPLSKARDTAALGEVRECIYNLHLARQVSCECSRDLSGGVLHACFTFVIARSPTLLWGEQTSSLPVKCCLVGLSSFKLGYKFYILHFRPRRWLCHFVNMLLKGSLFENF